MQDNLTELMSSRICHDLISPVGAIGNGLELMGELSGPSPELELIGQSAQAAQAKLKFFRIAFGVGTNSFIGGPEAERTAIEMFPVGRISVRISKSWGARERRLVKLFYLLLLCVESTLSRGGKLVCTPTESGWKIEVESSPTLPLDALWQHVLTGHNGIDVDAKTIQFLLARQCLVEQSMSLKLDISESALCLEF